MICNQCGMQLYDGANFCPNCGVQFNPNVYRYQQPQNFPQGNFPENGESDKMQKAIFTLGLVSFCVNVFWIFIGFLQRFIGFNLLGRSGFFYQSLSVLGSVVIVFLSFIFAKKQNHKTILLILFIVLVLFEIYQFFFRHFFGYLF